MISLVDKFTLEDVNKINDLGYYANITKDIFMKLSDEQIKTLRKRFPQCQIAKKRLRSNSKSFRLFKQSNYRKMSKGQNDKNATVKVAIGGVIVTMSVVLATLMGINERKGNKFEVIDINSGIDFGGIINEEVSKEIERVREIQREETQQAKIIKKYCNVYQVDFDVVYKKISDLTDNFTSSSYLNDLHIDGVVCKSKDVYANSEEELLLLAVRCIKQKPELLGLKEMEIRIKNNYNPGDDYVALINEISKVLNSDRVLIYSIFQAETSFNSDIYFDHNNPGGMKDEDGNWWHFDNKYQGFIELCLEVRKYNEMGAYSIEEIACIHAPVEDNNENWIPNVTSTYETLKDNEEAVFGDEMSIDGKIKKK